MTRNEPKLRPAAPRVIVVHHDQARRSALRAGLQAAGIVVIAEADNRRDVVDLCAHFEPDVVLAAADATGGDGIGATRAIAQRVHGVHVVLLTNAEDEELAIIGLLAGATGHVADDAPMPEVVDAVRRAAAGQPVLSPGVAMQLIERLRALPESGLGVRPVRSVLTTRQWEVLDLLCAGLSVGEVADRLVISHETARTHVKHILRRLGARSQLDAIRIAREVRARFAPEQPTRRA
jgi:NarL family two-component system response regulator LiaR